MAENNEEIANEKEPEEVKMAIDWRIPEGTMTPFATNMLVQTVESAYKISFFEAKPPIRLDKNEPMPEKIIADCVGSIIVTPDKLITFTEVLQRQVDILKKKTAK